MLKFVQLGLFTLLMACLSVPVAGQAISPAMLEQFKQLPRAEQERLAKQYGYELSALTGKNGTSDNTKPAETEPLQPRHTEQTEIEKNGEKTAEEKLNDKKPKRFGMSLFSEKISTFAPVNNMPVPDDYILGPEDSLQVQLYGKQNSEYNLQINRDGSLTIPDLAPLNVAGLRFSAARELIQQRVAQAMIGTNAAVSMGAMRTINVFIAGEAKNPGMYAVSALTSVTQALFVAGGVSDIGSLRNISVKRSGKQVTQFDLYQLLLKGDNSNDVKLQHGDVLFVPPLQAQAEVQGEILRPALYELKSGETVDTLIAMSGGLKPSAFVRAATLESIDSKNLRTMTTLDLSTVADRNVVVKNGDILRLSSISSRVENQVTLAGAVVRPGKYAWKQGMKVSDLVQNIWSDLLLSSDLDYAVVVRETNNQGDISILQISLAAALENNPADNISLAPRDKLLVFHVAGQSYQRDLLNKYLREQLTDTIKELHDNPALAGDIASRSFDALKDENRLLDLNNEKLELQQTLNVDELSKARLMHMLTELYANAEYLAYTPQLTRTELLFPILQKLKLQSSNQKMIRIVSVSGDVKVPGEYPLAENAGVSELIAAAGGLTASSYLARAELSRYQQQAKDASQIIVEHQNINIADILSGNSADISLQSRDRLNVFSTPQWSVARKVSIEGEVRFPGEYSILKGETLQDLINRAGGFTEDAFVFGAIFTREQIRQREQEQVARLLEQLKADVATRALSSQPSSITPLDALTMVNELGKYQPVGRLVINAEQIQAGNPEYNIMLEDGDRLVVPRKNRSVSIIGEVQVASTHRYDASLNVERYLQLAGGMRKRADEDRVYVIRADGSVYVPSSSWFAVTADGLQPGDTIVVPVDTEYKDSLTLWAQVTQIFYQSFVAIAALKGL